MMEEYKENTPPANNNDLGNRTINNPKLDSSSIDNVGLGKTFVELNSFCESFHLDQSHCDDQQVESAPINTSFDKTITEKCSDTSGDDGIISDENVDDNVVRVTEPGEFFDLLNEKRSEMFANNCNDEDFFNGSVPNFLPTNNSDLMTRSDSVIDILSRSRRESINRLSLSCGNNSLISALERLQINVQEKDETFLSCNASFNHSIDEQLLLDENAEQNNSTDEAKTVQAGAGLSNESKLENYMSENESCTEIRATVDGIIEKLEQLEEENGVSNGLNTTFDVATAEETTFAVKDDISVDLHQNVASTEISPIAQPKEEIVKNEKMNNTITVVTSEQKSTSDVLINGPIVEKALNQQENNLNISADLQQNVPAAEILSVTQIKSELEEKDAFENEKINNTINNVEKLLNGNENILNIATSEEKSVNQQENNSNISADLHENVTSTEILPVVQQIVVVKNEKMNNTITVVEESPNILNSEQKSTSEDVLINGPIVEKALNQQENNLNISAGLQQNVPATELLSVTQIKSELNEKDAIENEKVNNTINNVEKSVNESENILNIATSEDKSVKQENKSTILLLPQVKEELSLASEGINNTMSVAEELMNENVLNVARIEENSNCMEGSRIVVAEKSLRQNVLSSEKICVAQPEEENLEELGINSDASNSIITFCIAADPNPKNTSSVFEKSNNPLNKKITQVETLPTDRKIENTTSSLSTVKQTVKSENEISAFFDTLKTNAQKEENSNISNSRINEKSAKKASVVTPADGNSVDVSFALPNSPPALIQLEPNHGEDSKFNISLPEAVSFESNDQTSYNHEMNETVIVNHAVNKSQNCSLKQILSPNKEADEKIENLFAPQQQLLNKNVNEQEPMTNNFDSPSNTVFNKMKTAMKKMFLYEDDGKVEECKSFDTSKNLSQVSEQQIEPPNFTESDEDDILEYCKDIDWQTSQKFQKQSKLKLEICLLKQKLLNSYIRNKKLEESMLFYSHENSKLVNTINELKSTPNLDTSRCVEDLVVKQNQKIVDLQKKNQELLVLNEKQEILMKDTIKQCQDECYKKRMELMDDLDVAIKVDKKFYDVFTNKNKKLEDEVNKVKEEKEKLKVCMRDMWSFIEDMQKKKAAPK